MAQLEIACFNLQSALIAQQNGADRVELCSGIEAGGTTPDFEMVESARRHLTIDLHVMIRPRGGNFVYTESEFAQMKYEILAFKKMDVDGFVFGVLDENNQVAISQNMELVNWAKPLPCTFHRAFDAVPDVSQSLEDVIGCGFQAVLTSGKKSNAAEGIETLNQLARKADNRIIIMPGGGLRSSNIEIIQQSVKAVFYHSSAITDGSGIANPDEVSALKSNLK